MTDLTDKWKKGKIPSGFYYIKRGLNKYIYIEYLGQAFFEGNIEVIELVPTFEEWKASEKYNKHLEEVIKIYERKDKQATETSLAYEKLLEENEKLKMLLKRARDLIRQIDWCESFYAYNDGLDEEINEVLKQND